MTFIDTIATEELESSFHTVDEVLALLNEEGG